MNYASELYVRDSASPCNLPSGNGAFSSTDAAAGNWHNICPGHVNVYSTRKVQLSDLPIGIGFRCNHDDNWHVGFDSVGSRTASGNPGSSWQMPYANTECHSSSNSVEVDWFGSHRSTVPLARSTQDLILWVEPDRRVYYYIDGMFQRGTDPIPESAFPIEFTLSDQGNPNTGSLENLRWIIAGLPSTHY